MIDSGIIYGVDPSPTSHAIVRLDRRKWTADIVNELSMLSQLRSATSSDDRPLVAFEQFEPRGQSLSDASFRTVFETGRLVERLAFAPSQIVVVGIRRRFVKEFLCGTSAADDKRVREELILMWGGEAKALGVKGNKAKKIVAVPGPLSCISTHHWAALAVAVAATDPGTLARAAASDWCAVKETA